ncbi:MAG: BrnT family toxin [Thermoanaerobaculia bacterium]
MAFEWDSRKAAVNRRKHGVDFADAVAVLEDPLAMTVEDFGRVERRYLTIGLDTLGRLLVVSYTWRQGRIRLISARRATARERRQYEGGQ